MTGMSSLNTIFAILCMLIASFYIFRLVSGSRWLGHVDAENEVGHAMMALGMLVMLAPAGWLSVTLLHWNMLLFAAACVWWTCRLFVRKPVLALLLDKTGVLIPGQSEVRSDAIHVVMHGGMCYMFLLMSSMVLSMTLPATYFSSLLFAAFAFLTLFYGREVAKDLQAAELRWMQLGANVAHVLMSGIMGWMFLEMLFMVVNMRS
jgi:hypothetical protein